jgi:demethylspheroidene O-methyltransferase
MTSAVAGPAQALDWRERWRDRRDRWLADPAFRRRAAQFALTRPVARQRARELFDLVSGFVYSQWLLACVELHLFDRMAAAPLTVEDLAREARLPPASAQRLLDAATALGLAERRLRPGAAPRYGLGPLGAAMVGNPAVSAMVEHHRTLYRDLADPVALLREGPRRGRPLEAAAGPAATPGQATGTPAMSHYWPYAHAPAPGALGSGAVQSYSALMSASQPLVAEQVLDAYRIGRHRHLLDVGGGEGAFVTAALQRAPALRATLFDLPAVAARATQRLARAGLQDRAQAVGGDFFVDALPQGADVISLVRVIYDHDDARALALLRAVRAALPAGGTLLLAEPMAETEGAERMGAAYFGMYLLAMGSGRSRSASDLQALLREAGFRRVKHCSTALPLQTGLLIATAP